MTDPKPVREVARKWGYEVADTPMRAYVFSKDGGAIAILYGPDHEHVTAAARALCSEQHALVDALTEARALNDDLAARDDLITEENAKLRARVEELERLDDIRTEHVAAKEREAWGREQTLTRERDAALKEVEALHRRDDEQDAEIARLREELAAQTSRAETLRTLAADRGRENYALRAKLKEAEGLLREAGPALRSVVPVDALVERIRAFLDRRKQPEIVETYNTLRERLDK